MSLIWYPQFDIQFQSTISVVHKFMYLNGATHKDVVSLTDIWPLDFNQKTRETDHVYMEREQRLRDSLIELLSWEDAEYKDLPIHDWKLISDTGKLIRKGFSKFCPECIEIGYHSVWHEFESLPNCFIHGTPLIDTCNECGEKLHPSLRQPNQCSNGHEILTRCSDPKKLEITRRRVDARSQQLMTWQTLAFSKAVSDGLIYRPSRDVPPPDTRRDSDEDTGLASARDFRNKRLSEGTLVSICSKLYNGDRIPALVNAEKGLRVSKKTFRSKSLHFDASGWQRYFMEPSDRYVARRSGEYVYSIMLAIIEKLQNNLTRILDDLNREFFSEHEECEAAQTEFLSDSHPVHWPALCVFGLIRITMKEIWLHNKEFSYGRRVSVPHGAEFIDVNTAISLSIGHFSHISIFLETNESSRDEIEEFMLWLFTAMLRVEVKDYMEYLYYDFQSSVRNQSFSPPPLEDFVTERAWLVKNCAEGIELKRIDHSFSRKFIKEESNEAARHVPQLVQYYKKEREAYDRWLAGTAKRTSKIYKICTGESDITTNSVLSDHKRWAPILTGRLRRNPLWFI